jgi:hypothetical protein
MKKMRTILQRLLPRRASAAGRSWCRPVLPGAGAAILSLVLLAAASLPHAAVRADVVRLADPIQASAWTGSAPLQSTARMTVSEQGSSSSLRPQVDQRRSDSDSLDDGLKPMRQLTLDTKPQSGEMPLDLAAAKFTAAGQVSHGFGTNRPWNLYSFWWESPAFCHQPLYFEEINVERYGYSHGFAQPALSAAHFFGTVPVLPYLMGATPPRECVYTLGHYLPGSYAPYHVYYPPRSLRGAVFEAGAVTGLFFLLP